MRGKSLAEKVEDLRLLSDVCFKLETKTFENSVNLQPLSTVVDIDARCRLDEASKFVFRKSHSIVCMKIIFSEKNNIGISHA